MIVRRWLGILLFVTTPAMAQVRWQVKPFDTVCRPKQRLDLPVATEAYGELGRLRWIAPDRIAMIQFRANRVQVLDGNLKPLFSFGRKGNGPGEFQLASDVARVSDSLLGVTDPMQMRVHLFTLEGKFVRSFMTSRFPPKRIIGLPGNRIAVAGLSNVDSTLQFLSVHGLDGSRIRTAFNAPEPFRSIRPRNDEAVLLSAGDGSIVLVPSALDTVFLLRKNVESHFGLSLPAGYWNQLGNVDRNQPFEKIRDALDGFSFVVAGGLSDDSTLALGWRVTTRDGDPQWVVGLIGLNSRQGVLLTDVPGWTMGFQGATLWLRTEELDVSNVVQSYSCDMRLPGA